jgi:hypothetical protein
MIPIMNDQQRTDNELAAMGAGDWGYRVFPRPGGGNLGYGELAVAIRERPTHQHFDPLRLRFRLLDPEGDVRWRTASWRVPVMDSGRICPGPVTLADRYEKEVEFFTFGGAVDVISNPIALVYLFTSAAPILELTAKANAVSDQLASEAEEIIGRVGEQWQEEYDEGFAERAEQRRGADIAPGLILCRPLEAPRCPPPNVPTRRRSDVPTFQAALPSGN